jgi:YVTN family beta-propeller protein
LFVLAFLLSGCRSNPAAPPLETPAALAGVYVVNEGNFMRGNSTLTLYIPDSAKAYQDVFMSMNGRPLGDTGNDIAYFAGKIYIVVSGSQKIEVISAADQKSVGTLVLPGQRNPYKLAIVNDARAYVTNLSDTAVTSFNPSTLQIIADRIKVGKNPQGIAYSNGKIYVCNSGFGYDSTVTVLNATTGSLIRTIVVGDSPSDIGVGANNEVFVKCDGRSDWGDPTKDTPGSIVAINSDNDVIINKAILPLTTYGHPGRMTVGSKGYGFFVSKHGIQQFRFFNSLIEINVTLLSTLTAYGLTLDDTGNLLYATDAKDYVQNGEVYVYDLQGVQKAKFQAGVIPGAITFKR